MSIDSYALMIPRMDPVELLAGSELFNGATAGDFESLRSSAVTRNYGDGQLIFAAGDPADAMYLVLSGGVIASRLGPDGEEYVVEVFVPGDVLGPLHFFEPRPVRILNARAAETTSCWIVPRGDFMRLLERKPQLMQFMLRTYSRWIVQRDLRDADSSFRNLTAQVATKLLHLAGLYGERVDSGIRISLRITETTLANMLGASRENVSRAVAQLQRNGDVRREGGRFLLTRPDRLRDSYSWMTEEEAQAFGSRRRGVTRPKPESG